MLLQSEPHLQNHGIAPTESWTTLHKYWSRTSQVRNEPASLQSTMVTAIPSPVSGGATAGIGSHCSRTSATTVPPPFRHVYNASLSLLRQWYQCYLSEMVAGKAPAAAKFRGNMKDPEGWILQMHDYCTITQPTTRYKFWSTLAYVQKEMSRSGGNLTSIGSMLEERSRTALGSTMAPTLSRTGLLTRWVISSKQVLSKNTWTISIDSIPIPR